jgi:ABC-2 type transport system ATP-binding protein
VEVMGYTPFERKSQFLKKIALVMGQKNQLWWDLPASDTFLLNKEIYEIPDAKFKKTVDSLVEMLNVADVLSTPARKLSLGQRMKMELIAALLHSPKVLFLDEPTIGLDVVMQQSMRDFIKEYNRESKATIILTSHYMDDVKKLCKRVIMIDHGLKMYDGLLDDLVAKYAPNKFISVTLDREVKRERLQAIAPIQTYEFPKVTFEVKREQATDIAGKLLAKLKVVDVNIEEPRIEDIIRDVFKGKAGQV